MTRMTRPDCAVMCNLINIHTYINTYIHTYVEDQCEWHRMTRMTGPDCVVMCNLINTYIHTYIHTYTRTYIHHTYSRTRVGLFFIFLVRLTITRIGNQIRFCPVGYKRWPHNHTHTHTRLIRGFRDSSHLSPIGGCKYDLLCYVRTNKHDRARLRGYVQIDK